MRRRITNWAFLLCLALGTAKPADARPGRPVKLALTGTATGAATIPTPALGADATAPVGAEAEPSLGLRSDPQNLNHAEMLSLVKKYAAEIASAVVDGERHREEAVRQRDAIKLSCIQDRLSNMKLMKRLSNNRLAAAARPSVQADELSLRHEFRGVEMARERVLELHRELIECAGGNLEVATTSQPSTSSGGAVDPGGINVDTTPVDRPIPASLYK